MQGSSRVEAGASCSPAPAVATTLPADFPVAVALPAGAVLTGLQQAEGFTLATGRVEGTARDALAHFRAALPQAGLLVGRDEDEGRGGELTFLGGATEGSVTVALLRCPAGTAQFTLAARSTR